ncbi:MAG: hypothetical protein NDI84_08400 [Steroidobacteraceae bacterium]|nr:hypothetical protein [Steroidobacteraceae bacterium]
MVNWRRLSWYGPRATTDRWRRPAQVAAACALLVTACGHAGEEPPAPAAIPAGDEIFCAPADEGGLQARLQGLIDAEIDWSAGHPQCRGGPRPGGDGIRLIYKGTVDGDEPLLVVFGIGPLRAGESARNVPVNLTLVREGTGQFFATQGHDKCALDEVRQVQLQPEVPVYRVTGRGYCTQPARAVAGEGSVLVSRFDVVAIVDYR